MKTPVWRSPGLPGLPPHRSRLTFSHIPTDRHAALRTGPGAGGLAVDFRKTHFGCVSLKIDSRAAKVNPKVMTFRTWPEFFFFVHAEKFRPAPEPHNSAMAPAANRCNSESAPAAPAAECCKRESQPLQPLKVRSRTCHRRCRVLQTAADAESHPPRLLQPLRATTAGAKIAESARR